MTRSPIKVNIPLKRFNGRRSNSSELQISSFKDLGAVINYFDK